MSNQFATVYTNADLANGNVSPYDDAKFNDWIQRLRAASDSSGADFPCAILSIILCAHRRGEAIAPLFHHLTKNETVDSIKATFSLLRESITVIVPWIGFSNCMSACFSLIGELKKRQVGDTIEKERPGFLEVDYLTKGLETNAEVYRGIGSTDAREMIGQFFPSLSYVAAISTFGYLLEGSAILSLKDSICLVAASVTALGATRQARTLTKAALRLGNSDDMLSTVVQVTKGIAKWDESQVSGIIDVRQLRAQLHED